MGDSPGGGHAAGAGTNPAEVARRGARILLEGGAIRTGQTPKTVIWSRNKARLFRYVATAERRFRVPVLLVYALINRPYVLDLLPGNSIVEYLVGQGFDVYLLDWGVPGDEDADLAFDEYVLDYLAAAVRQVARAAECEELTLFGYCMGGTMAAMYAALAAPGVVRNLALLTAPISFARGTSGLLGEWLGADALDVEHLAAAFGTIPAEVIDLGMKMLRPVPNYLGTQVTMWERLRRDAPMATWLAMNKWVNDGIPFAGAAFRQWVVECYQRDALVKAELRLRGRVVDLASITAPVLVIAGQKDHICTVAQAEAILPLVASADKQSAVLDAGHVGLLTGSEARAQLWPTVRGWLAPRSR
ncbi:MAG TPA: alpha/beta fold hydrolase [Ktedonobacterales bacterium]|nr:alpha/beta fold hydrolase [Ktedonobacterales bacterium]